MFLSTTLTLVLSMLFPIKIMVFEILKRKGNPSCGLNILVAFLLCSVLAGFSVAISQTSFAIRVIGLTCYPVMCFVFPALFYIATPCKNKLVYFLAWVLLLGMCVFIAFGVLDLIS